MAGTKKKIKKEEKENSLAVKDSLYSNGISLNIGDREIVVDFFQNPPSNEKSCDALRIVMNPVVLKRFSKVFVDVVKKYEEKYGEIEASSEKWNQDGEL